MYTQNYLLYLLLPLLVSDAQDISFVKLINHFVSKLQFTIQLYKYNDRSGFFFIKLYFENQTEESLSFRLKRNITTLQICTQSTGEIVQT